MNLQGLIIVTARTFFLDWVNRNSYNFGNYKFFFSNFRDFKSKHCIIRPYYYFCKIKWFNSEKKLLKIIIFSCLWLPLTPYATQGKYVFKWIVKIRNTFKSTLLIFSFPNRTSIKKHRSKTHFSMKNNTHKHLFQ